DAPHVRDTPKEGRIRCPLFTNRPPPRASARSSTPAHRPHAGAPPPGRHRTPFLSQLGLCLSRLGRLGQPAGQWPSEWRSLAATAVYRLSPLLLGDPRHPLSRPADLA